MSLSKENICLRSSRTSTNSTRKPFCLQLNESAIPPVLSKKKKKKRTVYLPFTRPNINSFSERFHRPATNHAQEEQRELRILAKKISRKIEKGGKEERKRENRKADSLRPKWTMVRVSQEPLPNEIIPRKHRRSRGLISRRGCVFVTGQRRGITAALG